ncbi:hypothetical protein F441_10263, partial [Phytophthora nicotianae CJ01A1]
ITCDDDLLWNGYIKNTLDGENPGMRFVLFSSCGNLDFYRIIPPENTFGLDSKPGLHLTRVELDEMVHSSCVAIVCDPVWIMCLQHIGIARSMLTFLSLKFRSMRVGMISAGDMEMELRSPGLLEYSGASYRGIATPDALERVKQAHDLSAESYRKIYEAINVVASGKVVHSHDWPTSQNTVELLTKYGFLYEDQTKQLQFPSNVHLKIWLQSTRTHPMGYHCMASDIWSGTVLLHA